MEPIDILRLVPVWVAALAMAWGINKALTIADKWRSEETKRDALERTSEQRRRKLVREISVIAHEIEELYLPVPIIAMTTGPEELSDFKAAIRPQIESIKFFDQVEHYDLKKSLFKAIDMAFGSAHAHHSGWMQEVLMYTSLEMLRALNQVHSYYEAHDVIPSECSKFVQVQADLRRAYEDSFESLARLRRLA